MSWLGNLFTGNQKTQDTTDGTYAGVGQTTPSTLDYTSPTYGSGGGGTVGTSVHSSGYVSTTSTTSIPTGGLAGMGV